MTCNIRDALKKSLSFRTLRRLHELAKLSNPTTLFTTCLSNAPSASDVASLSLEVRWSHSCLTIRRTQNSSAACTRARISSFENTSIQMTQILLEEYSVYSSLVSLTAICTSSSCLVLLECSSSFPFSLIQSSTILLPK